MQNKITHKEIKIRTQYNQKITEYLQALKLSH